MNERIRELAEQAGFNEYINENLWLEEQPEFNKLIEKFAELIVNECLNNMQNCDGDLDFAIWNTKQDFGV
jgi:hypothetical protein